MAIELRAATSADAAAVARICLLAGGGAFEYLYGELDTNSSAESVLTGLCALESAPYSYRWFTLAESDGEIVGGVNAISMDDLKAADLTVLPALKNNLNLSTLAVLRSALRRMRLGLRMQGRHPDADSLILGNVAVFPGFNGRGIGAQLVNHVQEQATKDGYPSVSLVVWDTNDRARSLYERLGFSVVDKAPFKPLASMPYRGRYLMVANTQDG